MIAEAYEGMKVKVHGAETSIIQGKKKKKKRKKNI